MSKFAAPAAALFSAFIAVQAETASASQPSAYDTNDVQACVDMSMDAVRMPHARYGLSPSGERAMKTSAVSQDLAAYIQTTIPNLYKRSGTADQPLKVEFRAGVIGQDETGDNIAVYRHVHVSVHDGAVAEVAESSTIKNTGGQARSRNTITLSGGTLRGGLTELPASIGGALTQDWITGAARTMALIYADCQTGEFIQDQMKGPAIPHNLPSQADIAGLTAEEATINPASDERLEFHAE